MLKRFKAWLKEWYDAFNDPDAWDDSNDPCPCKCKCNNKKERE